VKQLLALIAVGLTTAFSVIDCNKSSRPEPVDDSFYISFIPDSVSADIGDTIALTGYINSVENLFAISFDLIFDTSVVDIQDLSLPPNGVLGQNALSFFNAIDGGVSVSLGRIQTSANDNVSASGSLFEIDLVAMASDTTIIIYQNVYIIDENGAENGELAGLERRGAKVITR
jgi:hypothetical protein